ncbi:hypothetical protein EG68_10062 [Paragonimus skrjabini miyazakii]|uniref:Uncharacterized protein n=1 Tax=Paragonimus skrjabini miyazakii TaxID=59628 RepID=A0A8S9YAQ7_9TREM|nr:hypothetical protein EG68_10062 [Paragonimus skrjabini miyazakii]
MTFSYGMSLVAILVSQSCLFSPSIWHSGLGHYTVNENISVINREGVYNMNRSISSTYRRRSINDLNVQ